MSSLYPVRREDVILLALDPDTWFEDGGGRDVSATHYTPPRSGQKKRRRKKVKRVVLNHCRLCQRRKRKQSAYCDEHTRQIYKAKWAARQKMKGKKVKRGKRS